ncbi:MAG: AraC family transcriptional regulator [Myxococcales bacterium]|nr:AraC family transcriptional regulator [Myxococcales bacterium]
MMQVAGRARPLSFDGAGEREPLLCSAATGWSGVPFELHQTVPSENAVPVTPPPGQHQLRVIVEGSFEVVMRAGGRYIRRRSSPGAMSLHSGTGSTTVRVMGSAKAVVVPLPEAWLRRLTLAGALPQLGTHGLASSDVTACALAQAMCTEVERGAPTGALFAESLSTALLTYALERVPLAAGPMQVRGALSASQRHRLRRHIDERLMGDLRVSELAAVCGLGLRHFSTLFRRAFGVSPHRYVLQRRLQRGADLLAHSGCDIAEIALNSGFSSQSHFSTAFKRAYGVTPRQFAMDARTTVTIPDRNRRPNEP